MAKLIDQLALELQPVKPVSSPWRATVGFTFTAILCVAVWFFGMHLRSDLAGKLGSLLFLLQLFGLLVMSLAAAFALVMIGRPGQAGVRRLAKIPFLAIGVLGAIYAFQFARVFLKIDSGDSLDAAGLHCTIVTLSLSVVPFALFFYASKRGAPLYLGLSGALIGLASWSLSAIALFLTCANDEPAHIFSWHIALPALVLALAGFFLGRKFLRW